MLRLAREVPNIVGLKDAAGDPPATAHLIAEAPPDFEVYSGDDVMTLPLLAVGAVGVISVAAHWVGSRFRQVVDAFLAGDLDTAIAGHAELLDSFDFESSADYPNPLPAKAAMRSLGLQSANADCPWETPRPSSTPRRPRSWPRWARRRSQAQRLAERKAQARTGRLPGRPGRNRPQLCLYRGRGPHRHPRRRDHVPRSRHAGHRPGPARVHLPARPQGPGGRDRPHARPRGPHRRAGLSPARAAALPSTGPS